MTISDFLNNQYADSALYINYRSTPSIYDGLKNSARKVVYTIKKNNIKNQLKVSALGSKVVDTSGYLHGDASIQGTIVTMSQSYCGSNNFPILEGIGSFGTRHTPAAAAPRYIFAKPQSYFDLLFKKEDDGNLTNQFFEGDEIEPMFYIPTIPLLLVNGCSGIGVGFATKILARKTENIIQAIEDKLNNKKLNKELFIPGWNGFEGKVKYLGENKWEIRGIATINKNKVLIEELPISYNLSSYLKVLKGLKEKGIIYKYIDYSENDKFKFEITLSAEESNKSENEIFNDLALIENITENLVGIDENNSVKEFNSIEEIFNSYYDMKIKFLEKRINSEIERLSNEEKVLKEVYTFISKVIKGEIDVKVKKIDLEKKLKELKFTFIEKLISLPIYSLTEDKVEENKKKWENKVKELNDMKNQTSVTLWKKDLKDLKKYIAD